MKHPAAAGKRNEYFTMHSRKELEFFRLLLWDEDMRNLLAVGVCVLLWGGLDFLRRIFGEDSEVKVSWLREHAKPTAETPSGWEDASEHSLERALELSDDAQSPAVEAAVAKLYLRQPFLLTDGRMELSRCHSIPIEAYHSPSRIVHEVRLSQFAVSKVRSALLAAVERSGASAQTQVKIRAALNASSFSESAKAAVASIVYVRISDDSPMVIDGRATRRINWDDPDWTSSAALCAEEIDAHARVRLIRGITGWYLRQLSKQNSLVSVESIAADIKALANSTPEVGPILGEAAATIAARVNGEFFENIGIATTVKDLFIPDRILLEPAVIAETVLPRVCADSELDAGIVTRSELKCFNNGGHRAHNPSGATTFRRWLQSSRTQDFSASASQGDHQLCPGPSLHGEVRAHIELEGFPKYDTGYSRTQAGTDGSVQFIRSEVAGENNPIARYSFGANYGPSNATTNANGRMTFEVIPNCVVMD